MPEDPFPRLEIQRLGTIPYARALRLQTELIQERRLGLVSDRLLLLEHPPVITMGSSFKEEHLLLSSKELEERGLEVFRVGRGGDVTYHGPGQLVAYPILALEPDRRDLHRYLRDLEQVLMSTLHEFGIEADRAPGFTGVWVPEGKLAAIGVRVSSGWITSHGFALNVDPDLSHFSAIVPCGIQDRPVTSMSRLLGRSISVSSVIPPLLRAFETVFSRTCIVV